MNKKIAIIATLGALSSSGAFAYDGLVTMSGGGYPGQTAGGGAFLIDITQVTGTTGNLSDVKSDPFLTFCLERDENLPGGPTYQATKNNASVGGGTGGPSPDPISAATAKLYAAFANGTLDDTTSFTYNGTGADALQRAIWWLEEEYDANGGGGNGVPTNPVGSTFDYLLQFATGGNTLAAYTAAQGVDYAGNLVKVLNLKFNNQNYQDVLVCVPEPSTYIAGGLALLPLLFGLRSRISKR